VLAPSLSKASTHPMELISHAMCSAVLPFYLRNQFVKPQFVKVGMQDCLPCPQYSETIPVLMGHLETF
jgi:hypothetical protein